MYIIFLLIFNYWSGNVAKRRETLKYGTFGRKKFGFRAMSRRILKLCVASLLNILCFPDKWPCSCAPVMPPIMRVGKHAKTECFWTTYMKKHCLGGFTKQKIIEWLFFGPKIVWWCALLLKLLQWWLQTCLLANVLIYNWEKTTNAHGSHVMCWFLKRNVAWWL